MLQRWHPAGCNAMPGPAGFPPGQRHPGRAVTFRCDEQGPQTTVPEGVTLPRTPAGLGLPLPQ